MADSTMVPENANQGCVGVQSDDAGKAAGCAGCPNQKICASGEAKKPDPAVAEVQMHLKSVKHKILVLSGKGGVGKSSFACQLAWTLAARGKQVGILDVDICGPSVPRMLGLVGHEVHQSAAGWSPVYVEDNLAVMSIGFMLPKEDDAIIWRGPRKNGLIKQFLTDVLWEDLDYLIIDTPPGTSDEHISIVQYLKQAGVDGAVIVTTPQEVAMMDVRKEINFCKKTKIPVLGIVENMSGYQAPVSSLSFLRPDGQEATEEVKEVLKAHAPHLLDYSVSTEVFPAFGSGPQGMAKTYGVPFLGRLPLDPYLLKACEEGEPFVEKYPHSRGVGPFNAIVDSLVKSAENNS